VLGVLGANSASIEQLAHMRRTAIGLLDRAPASADEARELLGLAYREGVSSRDPWSGAGENTRAEVRENFARHAAAR
jgi:hypothetical protein